MKGTISEILEREDTNYRKVIDELLEKSTSVPFKISDMVRGKCVFLEVSDIIEAVKSIKEFVSKDPRFSIEEIESRFTNPLPISDVTLKIVISNRIVAELQLTIQTNAAAYNFAHKIYELQRTKVFSKLKIIHNYFEESNEDFQSAETSEFEVAPFLRGREGHQQLLQTRLSGKSAFPIDFGRTNLGEQKPAVRLRHCGRPFAAGSDARRVLHGHRTVVQAAR